MIFCFYGSGIYDSLLGKPPGGAELQVALLAEALSEKGHKVIIIDNKGIREPVIKGNLKVLFTTKSKVKGLRLLFEKIPNSFRYLSREKADYFYVRGFSYLYLIALYISKRKGAKFIIGLATDADVLSFSKRFQYVYRTRSSTFNWLKNDILSSLAGLILLRLADCRLVQHSHQRSSLLEKKMESVIFPNIFLPINLVYNFTKSNSLVYVGSLNGKKGFSDLLNLIRLCKDQNFKIIGTFAGKNNNIEKVKLFKEFKNVCFMGQMTREDVIYEIAKSQGLVNFSKIEGFPNTFLEAWWYGIPVYSLWVDPDCLIEKYHFGKSFNGDLNLMASFLKSNPIQGSSEKIREYISINHSYDSAADRFLKAVSQ